MPCQIEATSCIYEYLDTHNLNYERYDHPAVFTVTESQAHTAHIPGLDAKTLVVYGEKSKDLYLVSLEGNTKLSQSIIKSLIGERVRFADSDVLADVLCTTPGSVSPLGLIFDTKQTIKGYIIDERIWAADQLAWHPNINTQTLVFNTAVFKAFLDTLPHQTMNYSESPADPSS